MVPAHRQETQASLDPTVHTGGFAKVLTSIQGLQQRLDSFSADEADQAQANIQTLIEQIARLQSKLKRLEELKQFVFTSNSLIREIPERNFDRVDLDSLENHPQLHAIIRASKLIQMYKLMKVAKAEAESVSFDSEIGQLQFATPLENDNGSTALKHQLAHDGEMSVTVTPSTATPIGSEFPDTAAISLDPEANQIRAEDWVFSEDTELENGEPQFVDTTVAIYAAEHRPTRVNHTKSADAQKQSGSEASFDQRLLSDLIEAYGEFSPASRSLALVQSIASKVDPSETEKTCPSELSKFDKIETTIASQLVPQTVADRSILPIDAAANNWKSLNLPAQQESSPPLVPQPIVSGRNLVLSDISLPPKPAGDGPQPTLKRPSVPSVIKNGELDRQLKNIIKDYGEYDLYSQQNTISIKKAAIVAFALLGLVLCGFYFFKTTAPAVTSSARAIEPASVPSNTR